MLKKMLVLFSLFTIVTIYKFKPVYFLQGDGIDFKKHFMKTKELLKNIISRVPVQWPGIPSQT